MIYLKIAHTEDNDADYFSFLSILAAEDYIRDEKISEWVMSDFMFEEVSESDYTFIGSLNYNIGSDTQGYFVYEVSGVTLFRGSYTRCLIVIGGVSLGDTFKEAIQKATTFDINLI